MSTAKPMDTNRRVALYVEQNCRLALTPRQARRHKHKVNEAERGTARHGRLRRRFDRKDQREVKSVVRELVSIVRARKGARR